MKITIANADGGYDYSATDGARGAAGWVGSKRLTTEAAFRKVASTVARDLNADVDPKKWTATTNRDGSMTLVLA